MPKPFRDNTEEINEIKREVLLRFSRTFPGYNQDKLWETEKSIVKHNKKILKDNFYYALSTFNKNGFLTIKQYGYDIVKKFWYFIYLGDYDKFISFRKRYLFELEKNLKDYSLLRSLYAKLYDKIALAEGKKQRFGTQPVHEFQDSIEDVNRLKARRGSMGLDT